MAGNFVTIIADTSAPEMMIDKVALRTSPTGIQQFLVGSARSFLQQRVDARFYTEGDDATGKWAPLRPATAMIRARQGFGAQRPINERTGDLHRFVRDTFYTKTSKNTTTLVMPGKAGKELESKLRIAQRGGPVPHAKGSRFVGANTPAVPRPVIGLSITDEQGLTALLHRYVLS